MDTKIIEEWASYYYIISIYVNNTYSIPGSVTYSIITPLVNLFIKSKVQNLN